MKELIKNEITEAAISSLIMRGDLSGLDTIQKAQYYSQLCARVGLDPATTPFIPIKLNGKEILYANKGCAEQLRMLHKVSVKITHREESDGVFYVYVSASTPDGRVDEDVGAVAVGNLKGDNLANARMKATTKAKRRVTLSILGLGMLDESELESIPRNNFENIPIEQPRSNVALLVPGTEETTKAKSKKWKSTDPIPDIILKGFPKDIAADLKSIPMHSMGEEDLELVVEQGKQCYTRWKSMPGVIPKALELLQEIVAQATVSLSAMNNPPPPDDNSAPSPEQFDVAMMESDK